MSVLAMNVAKIGKVIQNAKKTQKKRDLCDLVLLKIVDIFFYIIKRKHYLCHRKIKKMPYEKNSFYNYARFDEYDNQRARHSSD